MGYLVQPSDIAPTMSVIGLVYGQPGLGKSTLALSIPNSVSVDADKGMHRVQPRWRVASLPLNNYDDLLAFIDSPEIEPYSSLVVDTLGKLVDRIGEYVIRKNPKSGRSNGVLTMQGWGDVKIEFQNLLRLLRNKRKHLIFVAHEKEEKEGDVRLVRPDVAGASGKELIKELDFVGYMESRGDERTISFTPCEKFYAKNALKLPQVLKIPNPEITGKNDFLLKNIIERTEQNNADQTALNRKYDDVVTSNAAQVAILTDAKGVNLMIEEINKGDAIWDSQRVAKKALMDRAAVLGLEFDKEIKLFKQKETQEADEEKPKGKGRSKAKTESEANPLDAG